MSAPLESYIRGYGYFGVFLWAALGGEEGIVVAVWMVKKGLLNLPGVIVASALGGAVGDHVYFYLARHYGWMRLRRSARFQRALERAHALVARYGPSAVVASRFLIGLRITIPVVCGAAGMSPLTYSALNLVSAFFWAWFYGLALTSVWSASLSSRLWIGGAIVTAFVLILVLRFRQARAAHVRSVVKQENYLGICPGRPSGPLDASLSEHNN
jgi:membrane protein DedA with SNARE-associated domain